MYNWGSDLYSAPLSSWITSLFRLYNIPFLSGVFQPYSFIQLWDGNLRKIIYYFSAVSCYSNLSLVTALIGIMSFMKRYHILCLLSGIFFMWCNTVTRNSLFLFFFDGIEVWLYIHYTDFCDAASNVQIN